MPKQELAAAFQDLIAGNHCYGCGTENPRGLRIKSYWDGSQETVCRFNPETFHSAGPPSVLNGGIIATLVDCHCVCSSVAYAYRSDGREIGNGEKIWFVTGGLSVKYLQPTPLHGPVDLRARVIEAAGRKICWHCSVSVADAECATGEVLAIRVPASWRED